MRMCERGLNFFQVSNDKGDVRICTWTHDSVVGNLIESSYEEVWNGDKANKLRQRLCKDDYSLCVVDDCPYLSNCNMDQNKVSFDVLPDYPELLSLSYDNVCNYNCSTCDIHERYASADKKEMSKRFDKIEEELKKITPHVKEISANGQGEVFASDRLMKLLADWEPLAPASECRVSLETNGSLFDEEHWERIKNLGKYHLTVSVTIMSFDEYTYQQLSGVKYPISRIEKNLRFIKSLREKEIINYIELATVVQERNFRQLPEFTKRCIEEFGADEVRLRYFLPWHKKAPEVEWFADVRNPYHPYYQEFREIMKDPIFKHPKVNDWSGGRDSSLGEHPYKKERDTAIQAKEIAMKKVKILQQYIENQNDFSESIIDRIPKENPVIIYGIGEIGKLLFNILKNEFRIFVILDRYSSLNEYQGIPVVRPADFYGGNEEYSLIITPIGNTGAIIKKLSEDGININNIFDTEELCLCER